MIVAIVLFLLVYIFKLEESVDQQNHLGKEMLFSEHDSAPWSLAMQN